MRCEVGYQDALPRDGNWRRKNGSGGDDYANQFAKMASDHGVRGVDVPERWRNQERENRTQSYVIARQKEEGRLAKYGSDIQAWTHSPRISPQLMGSSDSALRPDE